MDRLGALRGHRAELATLADPDWFAVGWIVLGLGNLFSGLGTAGLWLVGGIVLVATVVTLLVLQRREARTPVTVESEVQTA